MTLWNLAKKPISTEIRNPDPYPFCRVTLKAEKSIIIAFLGFDPFRELPQG